MPIVLGKASSKGWGPPVRRPSLEPKKVALIGGSESTLRYAPWDDPSWKLWAHASCRQKCARMPDLLFDLHPKALWSDPVKKHWDPQYVGWLKQNTTPIYMQQRDPEAPASLEYPYHRIMAEWGQYPYVANQVGWMVALALTEGVTHIAVYGCEYAHDTEYGPQRGSAEFWLGVAIGRGVQVCLPPTSTLLREPRLLYGYESHPGGIRDKSYSKRVSKTDAIKTEKGKVDLTLIDPDSTDRPKLRPVLGPDGKPTGQEPDWARRLSPGKGSAPSPPANSGAAPVSPPPIATGPVPTVRKHSPPRRRTRSATRANRGSSGRKQR